MSASQTEVSLPKGWRWFRLEDLVAKPKADIVDGPFGSNLKASEYVPEGIPILRLQNVEPNHLVQKNIKFVTSAKAAELQRHTFQAGDLIVTKLGDPLGEACIVPESLDFGVIVADLVRVRLNSSRALLEAVCYAINSAPVHRQFEEQTKGTTRPRVNLSHIRGVRIPLPVDLADQRALVAEIEKQFTRMDAAVVSLKRVQIALKRYRASVLKAACEGRLVVTEAELARREGRSYETGEQLLASILAERRKNWTGRGKNKEPARFDTASLPPLHEGWMWASVEQLLMEPLINGISIKGSDNPPGVRALRLSAMSDSGFDYSDARYLPLSEPEVDDLWIKEGDFFMSRGNGSLHLVGRGTSAQKPPQPTIFPDTMIRLRLTSAVRTSGWIRTLWPSRILRSQIERQVKTTAGIYKIAQPQVEQLVVPLPPLAEQTRIVAEVEHRLSVVEELEAVLSANLQRAKRLRQSILHCAFTGTLAGVDIG